MKQDASDAALPEGVLLHVQMGMYHQCEIKCSLPNVYRHACMHAYKIEPCWPAQVWDLRSGQQSGAISSAHGMPVRDVDFAKQQDNLIVTAGDDCKLRLWDLRHAPVQQL